MDFVCAMATCLRPLSLPLESAQPRLAPPEAPQIILEPAEPQGRLIQVLTVKGLTEPPPGILEIRDQ